MIFFCFTYGIINLNSFGISLRLGGVRSLQNLHVLWSRRLHFYKETQSCYIDREEYTVVKQISILFLLIF